MAFKTLSAFFVLWIPFTSLAETFDPLSIRGDRFVLTNFELSDKGVGNFLTFSSDPLVTYFDYEICPTPEKNADCIQSTTIFHAIEIPASMGPTPTLKIWACASANLVVDPEQNCTLYTMALPEIKNL